MQILYQSFFLLLALTSSIIFSQDSQSDEHLPLYICTGSDFKYFGCLLHLIGCLHKTNYDHLGEIMVVDLGLLPEQKNVLNCIEKVTIHTIQAPFPNLLTQYKATPWGKVVPGWYAWKGVALKEALDKYPYVLWMDAGTTVLRPLDDLFKHIIQNDYFLINLGEEIKQYHYLAVGWTATRTVRTTFNLDSPENRWVLEQPVVLSGFIGATKNAPFLLPFYELAADMRLFEDDGTAAGGYGWGRQDQSVISALSYLLHLDMAEQVASQEQPSWLKVDGKPVPFYITWIKDKVNNNTHIFNSRHDMDNYLDTIKHIRFITKNIESLMLDYIATQRVISK